MNAAIRDLCDLESERALVGSIMVQPDLIAMIAPMVPADAFGDSATRFVYKAIERLWERRAPADMVNVLAELRSSGMRDESAGVAILTEYTSLGASWSWAETYAENVLRMARRRTLHEQAEDLLRIARASGDEPNVDELARSIVDAVRAFDPVKPSETGIASDVSEIVNEAISTWNGDLVERVTTTGFRSIDRMTAGGIRPEELWILAARPSMGKTSLIAEMAMRQAVTSPVVLFSLEMPKRRIIQRMIAARAGVPFDTALNPIGDMDDRNRWLNASAEIESLPIAIYDQRIIRGATVSQLESILERECKERGATVAYIDHLGYVGEKDAKRSAYERTSEATRKIKEMAHRTGAGVVLLSQLNREVETRPGCRPQLSDLRESGRIEEDADVVAFLYRRNYYASKGMVQSESGDYYPGSPLERVEVSVQKNRNGETSMVYLGWEGKSMKFHEVAA